MARAIAVFSVSVAAHMPHPFASAGHILSVFWHHLTHDALHPYRPERHYMRGPGPAWRAKHGLHPQG
jgi:hypothetical protein